MGAGSPEAAAGRETGSSQSGAHLPGLLDQHRADYPGATTPAVQAETLDTLSHCRSSNTPAHLPDCWTDIYKDAWKEKPAKALLETAGLGLLGYGALTKLPRLTNYLSGFYGATKLAISDGPDLATSHGGFDVLKYGLASLSDLIMIGGTAARWLPGAKSFSNKLSLLGIAGRTLASFLPDSYPAKAVKFGQADPDFHSKRGQVNVPLPSGASESRPYDIYVPEHQSGSMPLMIVLNCVAPADSSHVMEGETGLDRLAKEKKFIVVYPEAKGSHKLGYLGSPVQDWNSPGAGLTDTQSSYDDVDYIKAIIDQVKRTNKVDGRAIYAVGFSSGGEFAQHLRDRLPGTFAGIGSVHGTWLGSEAKPRIGDQCAFVAVLSDSDHMLPLNGGRGLMTCLLPRVSRSNPLMQAEIARMENQLAGPPVKATVGNVQVSEYIGANGQAPVKEYIIQGGNRGGILGALVGRGRDGIAAEHAWDGMGAGGWPILGQKNDLDTSRLLVEELLKYRRPDAG